MDNNPLPPTPPSSIPPAPEAPVSAPSDSLGAPSVPPSLPLGTPAPSTMQSSGSSKKPMMLMIIVILILAILGVGGFYYYQMMQSRTSDSAETPKTNTVDNKALETLSTEAESIQISDPDGQLMEIDQEITSLEATASSKPASNSAALKSR